ncbi:Zinc finger protein CONSTANS-LIKE 4 [Apostasia shenzhenica]|uniref:Zinc finger protein CONSTANS-LIKE 4 n=1 Tax=Apostasia shenzhenica TaxID=1088818 RepID=A0A2I0BGY5_9ASPA|nr:Zinc finger protein CONSTANS-LIKE 4 [Apostasia shenzhenica]
MGKEGEKKTFFLCGLCVELSQAGLFLQGPFTLFGLFGKVDADFGLDGRGSWALVQDIAWAPSNRPPTVFFAQNSLKSPFLPSQTPQLIAGLLPNLVAGQILESRAGVCIRGRRMEGARRECELCDREASLYCEADAAFLCWACDAQVHGANFLVARHVRAISCSGCGEMAAGNVNGPGSAPIRALCRSCSSDLLSPASPGTSSSSSSSCISTAESSSTESKRRRGRRSRGRP